MLSIRRMLMMEDDEDMKEWKLINDITLEEEASKIEITKDLENNNFQYDEIIFFLKSVGTSSNTNSNTNALFYLSNINVGFLIGIAFNNGLTRIFTGEVNAKPLYWNVVCNNSSSDTDGGNIRGIPMSGYSLVDPIEKINSIKIAMQACYFGTGTRLRVYGR